MKNILKTFCWFTVTKLCPHLRIASASSPPSSAYHLRRPLCIASVVSVSPPHCLSRRLHIASASSASSPVNCLRIVSNPSSFAHRLRIVSDPSSKLQAHRLRWCRHQCIFISFLLLNLNMRFLSTQITHVWDFFSIVL